MPLAEAAVRSFTFDLSAYPRWVVILAGAAVAAVALWLLMKVLKWTLWLLIGAVLLGGEDRPRSRTATVWHWSDDPGGSNK